MELSLFPCYQPCHSSPLYRPLPSIEIAKRRSFSREFACRCSLPPLQDTTQPNAPLSLNQEGRRALIGSVISTAVGIYVCDVAEAASTSRRALRASKIPDSEFTTLPNGLKYYDVKVGAGAKAVKGSRVAVHYVAKWKGITFMTSRQGLGVGGGTVITQIHPFQTCCFWIRHNTTPLSCFWVRHCRT